MIDDRCECGHDARDHDHGTLCFSCECPIFTDQNELDMTAPRGFLRGQRSRHE